MQIFTRAFLDAVVKSGRSPVQAEAVFRAAQIKQACERSPTFAAAYASTLQKAAGLQMANDQKDRFPGIAAEVPARIQPPASVATPAEMTNAVPAAGDPRYPIAPAAQKGYAASNGGRQHNVLGGTGLVDYKRPDRRLAANNVPGAKLPGGKSLTAIG